MAVNRQYQSSPGVDPETDFSSSGFQLKLPTIVPQPPTTSPGLIKVEKNLASFGFSTPSNKKIRGTIKKTVVFSRNLDGKRVEVRAVILPSAAYGLPITSDQDKYFALQQIITDRLRRFGEIKNPVGFTSAELLRILGLKLNAGKNYDDILEWASRMTLTGICSEGVVYFAGRKVWVSDTFHVFERFVSVGNQMPDGHVADQNYLWLSDWQLENINNNHLFPLDLETYKQLKNHIAKALVPLLQIWLYATREGGSFEKRYEDLCQLLNIRQYRHLSKIKEKLGPSLEELKKHQYLAGWFIKETLQQDGFKVIFYHGEKFHRDQIVWTPQAQLRESTSQPLTKGNSPRTDLEIDRELFSQMVKRGITEKACLSLLRNLKPEQQVMDQLEWGDYLLRTAPPRTFYNPSGFYLHLVKENVIPPEQFETSRKHRLREAAHKAKETKELEQAKLELAYTEYRKQAVDQYIQTNFTPEQFSEAVQTKRIELLRLDYWKRIYSVHRTSFDRVAERQFKADLAERIGLLSFADFQKKQALSVGTSTDSCPGTASLSIPGTATPELRKPDNLTP
jgi:hypothetical protein